MLKVNLNFLAKYAKPLNPVSKAIAAIEWLFSVKSCTDDCPDYNSISNDLE